MAKKEKVALDGLEKFNRISNPTNALFNLIFVIFSLTCIIPVLLVVSISLSSCLLYTSPCLSCNLRKKTG